MRLGMKRRIYNAEMRNRRVARGWSQDDLGKMARVPVHCISRLECLHVASIDPAGAPVKRIADALETTPEVIFPAWIKAIALLDLQEDRQAEMTPAMLSAMVPRLQGIPMAGPATQEADFDRNVLAQGLDDAMDMLSFREREILKLRFGITEGGATYTLEEVGRIFKVTRERVRGIEMRALSKLRSRPALSRLFCDSEDLPPPCPCSKCSEKFWTPDALGAHEAARHPKDPA